MHSGGCLPASHLLESNSTGEDPCGQVQVYPPGRRRQRWLHTFLQGLGTEEERAKTLLDIAQICIFIHDFIIEFLFDTVF